MKITDDKLDKLLKSEESHSFNKTFTPRLQEYWKPSGRARFSMRRVLITVIPAVIVIAAIAAVTLTALLPRPEKNTGYDDGDGQPVYTDSEKHSDGVADLPGNSAEEPPRNGETDPSGQDDKTEVQLSLPDWYAPGNLVARTVTVKNAAANAVMSQLLTADNIADLGSVADKLTYENIELTLTGGPSGIVGSRYVNVTSILSDSPHSGHGCLIYDTVRDEQVCFVCLAKEALGDRVLAENETLVVDDLARYDIFTFAIYDESNSRIAERMLYNVGTGELRSVPVLSSNDFGWIKMSSDARYIVTHDPRKSSPGCDDVYLIDLATMEYRNVSGDEPTFADSAFSPDGNNLLIALRNENGYSFGFESERCAFMLINTSTGAVTVCEGRVLSYADGLLVTYSRGIYHVYDRDTCEEIAPGSDVYAFDVRNGKLLRANAASGAETELRQAPDGIRISDNGEYLYTYNTGDKYINCYSLRSGESFSVALHDDFAQATQSLKNGYDILYNISTNPEMTELLICYSYSKKAPVDTETVRKTRMRDAIKDAKNISDSIPDLIDNIEMFDGTDTFEYTVYYGDGYTYVTVDIYSFVEDYRSGTFSAYIDLNDHRDIAPFGYENIVPLGSDKQTTDRYLSGRGYSVGQADIDHAVLLENGQFSIEKLYQYNLSSDYIMNIKEYYVFLHSSHGGETKDLRALAALVEEYSTCEKTRVGDILGEGSRLCGQILSFYPGFVMRSYIYKGDYYIYDGRYLNRVPEYFFADFESFCMKQYRSYPFHYVSGELAQRFIAGMSDGKRMDITDLETILACDHDIFSFLGYNGEVLYAGQDEYLEQVINVIFPVSSGDNDIGYVMINAREDGKIRLEYLFDVELNYSGDLLKDGISLKK